MASFYIFIPSNSDANNLIGKFKVKLPETIRLDGEWEVSMREFNYTRSWLNVGNEIDAQIQVMNFPQMGGQISLSIPLNNYDTPQQLMDTITYTINDFMKRVNLNKLPKYELYFDETVGRSCFKNQQLSFYIITSKRVAYMLGFKDEQLNYIGHEYQEYLITYADHPPDMNAGMYALMVHCDIVAPQLVGNTYANLLRIVPVSGRFNENINTIYNDEQYVSVMQKNLDSIEININDDSGKIVNFQFGRTFLTLHFRKRRRWVV